MMKCKFCGAKNDDNAVRCSVCGAKTEKIDVDMSDTQTSYREPASGTAKPNEPVAPTQAPNVGASQGPSGQGGQPSNYQQPYQGGQPSNYQQPHQGGQPSNYQQPYQGGNPSNYQQPYQGGQQPFQPNQQNQQYGQQPFQPNQPNGQQPFGPMPLSPQQQVRYNVGLTNGDKNTARIMGFFAGFLGIIFAIFIALGFYTSQYKTWTDLGRNDCAKIQLTNFLIFGTIGIIISILLNVSFDF